MMQFLAGKQKSAEKGHINTSKILMLALPGVKQYVACFAWCLSSRRSS
jgi:hypothetical protein